MKNTFGKQEFAVVLVSLLRQGAMVLSFDEGRNSVGRQTDTIVAAVGMVSETSLVKVLEKKNIPYHVIGDAKNPHRITDAMMDAQLLGEAL